MAPLEKPRPDEPEPDAHSPAVPGDSGASEFLSEESPEFLAMKAAQDAAREPAVEAGEPESPADAPASGSPVPTGQGKPSSVSPPRAVVVPSIRPRITPAWRPPPSVRLRRQPTAARRIFTAIGLILVFGGLFVAAHFLGRRRPGAPETPAATPPPVAAAAGPTTGSATLETRPPGAQVIVGGASMGITPVTFSLPPGSYDVELRTASAGRSLSLKIEAGATVREVVDLGPVPAATGRVEVTTDAPGARVTIDGVVRGVTPLSLGGLAPGAHRVAIESEGTTVYRNITVGAGATSTVVASVVPAGASGGWVTITSPVELTVMENGQILGTTRADRLMLPAGTHELQLVAAPFDFQTTVTANVRVGMTVTIPVVLPNGTLSINATPWADVSLDGQPIGSTPIGNLSVRIGPHELIYRHPQFGERRQTVIVKADTPVRASVDLVQQP